MADELPSTGVEISTRLAAEQLAQLCKQAAEQARGSALRGDGLERVRLDAESDGLLQFSTHKWMFGVRRTPLVSFEVRIAAEEDRRTLATRVTKVARMALKAAQPGTYTYDEFTRLLAELVRKADSEASVSSRD